MVPISEVKSHIIGETRLRCFGAAADSFPESSLTTSPLWRAGWVGEEENKRVSSLPLIPLPITPCMLPQCVLRAKTTGDESGRAVEIGALRDEVKSRTYWRKHSENSTNTIRRRTICYLNNICIPLYPKFAQEQANEDGNSTTIEVGRV